MSKLDKSAFFAATRLATATVTVEGFGDIEIKELDLKQRNQLRNIDKEDLDIGMAKVIVLACDSFDDDDVVALASMKSKVRIDLFNKILEISGLGETKKD